MISIANKLEFCWNRSSRLPSRGATHLLEIVRYQCLNASVGIFNVGCHGELASYSSFSVVKLNASSKTPLREQTELGDNKLVELHHLISKYLKG